MVDYDTKRVRPKNVGNPTYPAAVESVVARVFPALKETVHADSPSEVFPENLAIREPALRSLNPSHPDSISYSIRLKPLTTGMARVALDINNDEDALAHIRDHAALFEDHDFQVSRSRGRYRVVMDELVVEHADELTTDEFQSKFANRFIELVTLGHEIFHTTNDR